MIDLLINILVFAIVFGLIWWILTQIPIPAPFGRIVQVVLAVIAVLWLISLLFSVPGVPRFISVR